MKRHGIFTKFVCDFLVEQEPQWFTTERLKKNRDNKLYLDYVQHKEGKNDYCSVFDQEVMI